MVQWFKVVYFGSPKPSKILEKTKFNKDGAVSGAEFSAIIGCSLQALKKMFGKKLTENYSYIKTKTGFLVDPVRAKEELRVSVRRKSCKNETLLKFLEFDTNPPEHEIENPPGITPGDVADMGDAKVRSELLKSELRTALINEKILLGEFVSREEISKQLYTIGMELRDSFINIPDRVTQTVRAMKTDKEARDYLYGIIEKALLEVTKKAEGGL